MLGGPEFQRRLIKALEDELASELTNVLLAKDWNDFESRRGKIRAYQRAVEMAHEIVKQMEAS